MSLALSCRDCFADTVIVAYESLRWQIELLSSAADLWLDIKIN